MDFFPVISVATGRVIAGTSFGPNSERLAASINVHADARVATVGDALPMNPAYSKAKDPERTMLTALVAAALAADPAALAAVEAAANAAPAPAPAPAPEVKPAARRTRRTPAKSGK